MVEFSDQQVSVFDAINEELIKLNIAHPVRVGIDGVDGAGKTCFADSLGTFLEAKNKHLIRSSIDYFHNPKTVRYKKGKSSPEGYFEDSFNVEKAKELILKPLGPGGDLVYKTAYFDYRTDSEVDSPTKKAGKDSILVFDGIFLHRPELVSFWDFSIFLNVSFKTSYARMAFRDSNCSDDPYDQTNRRYLKGQELYLERCKPKQKASLVIDNEDWSEPFFA